MLGFAAANPSLGYTQGMSDLLAPLLVTLESPSDAYWALDALIKRSQAVICPRDDVMDVHLVSFRGGMARRRVVVSVELLTVLQLSCHLSN